MPESLAYLLIIFTCEDSEYDGSCLVLECEIHDPSSGLTTYIVKVWCISSDDDSECEHEIMVVSRSESPYESGDLECSWHPVGFYIEESELAQVCTIQSFEGFRIEIIEF